MVAVCIMALMVSALGLKIVQAVPWSAPVVFLGCGTYIFFGLKIDGRNWWRAR